MDKLYENSASGFSDYSLCFGDFDVIWVVCGCCILLGTLISYQPQNAVFIQKRSSYGVNCFMTFVTNLGQYLVALNIISLHVTDFVGMLQPVSYDNIHPVKVLSTFLTFLNMVMDWYTFKFVFVLNYVFVDIVPRPRRDESKIKRDLIWSRALVGILMTIELSLFASFLLIGVSYGFQSKTLRSFGRVMGTLSSIANGIQYLPQIITTCRLKERGSYSLVTLGIIMFGGTINMFFMWFGQGEDWTTVLPVGVSITEQCILFCICVYFEIRNRRKQEFDQEPLIPKIGGSYTEEVDPQKLTSTISIDTIRVSDDST